MIEYGKKLGVTRENALTLSEVASGFIGFNLNDKTCNKILDEFFSLAKDGSLFKGYWNNTNNSVSSDPRVKGHRHDQTVLSLLAHKYKMTNFSDFNLFLSDGNKTSSSAEFMLMRGAKC